MAYEYSLLTEINKKSMEAYVNARVYPELYWPSFFPAKYTPFLKYETLIGSQGNRVAADIVSFDSSAPLKTRKVIDKLTGDIPPTRMKKKMSEADFNMYDQLKAIATPDQDALLKLIFDDVDACVDGVNGRLDWLTIQALALGKIDLSATNNGDGIITQATIDFQRQSDNETVMAAANRYWTAATIATSKPITDIQTIVEAARDVGVELRYILMNRSKFNAFAASAEVKDFVTYKMFNGTAIQFTPGVTEVNTALSRGDLPLVVMMDTRIDIETADHTITSTDPWLDSAGADRYVTFLENLQVGDMFYCPTAEEKHPPKQVTQAKVGPILITKFSKEDPVAEFTKGEINAFPSWPTIDRSWSMDTESHTTYGA